MKRRNRTNNTITIELPKGFEYSVVNKGEFRWWKRFYKPSWFKSRIFSI